MGTWTGRERQPRKASRRAGYPIRLAVASGLVAVLCLSAYLVDTPVSSAQGPGLGTGASALGAPRMSARDLIARRADPAAPANKLPPEQFRRDGNNAPANNLQPGNPPVNVPPVVEPAQPASPESRLAIPIEPSKITTEASKYVKQVAGPDNTLEVIVGRLQVFDLLGQPRRVQVGDESVANYALLSTRELSLQGLRVGSTVLNVWFQDQADPNKSKLVSFLVRVMPDPDARNRLERAYKNLEKEVNRVFPDSKVRLVLVGDKLAVTGQAKDIADANMIMRMVNANLLHETADTPDLSRTATADPINTLTRISPAFHRQVINLLRVPGEQQIMLQVQVVEVNRAAARSVGLNFGGMRQGGSWFVGGTTGNLANTGMGAGLGGAFANFGGLGAAGLAFTGVGGLPNLPIALDNGQIQLACLAMRDMGYSRYLAEPNLVAINGQTANFQVGGLLPVPVVTGTAMANLGGVNFIPTGVQLAFTPFITDRDRVRLTINAEISDRDLNAPYTKIEGASIPTLVTRNFSTTVELREGQTLAVAGLIENKLDADSARVPFLEIIPILGRIAGFDRVGNYEKELVILVTPRLVHPLECNEVPPLPGLDVIEPNDWEFYLLGRLESHTGVDYRSPIRTDHSRRKQARALEQQMLVGPSGPSLDLPPDASEANRPMLPELPPNSNLPPVPGRLPPPTLNNAPAPLPGLLPPPPVNRPANSPAALETPRSTTLPSTEVPPAQLVNPMR
ncbi:MAG: pilus assembly protein N-terminal domain-containing protein [Gemmataceae bacterium]